MKTTPILGLALALAALLPACTVEIHTDGETVVVGDVGDEALSPKVATVGMAAPDFTLTGVDGETYQLSEITKAGKTVVLEWFNPDCPVSKRFHVPENKMAAIFKDFRAKDVVWLAINSGAPGNQGHGLERNKEAVKDYKIPYPVLIDEDGKVGRLYAAKTTPHMYVIDAKGVLRFAGGIDDKKETNYVRAALTSLAAGETVAVTGAAPYGCSVKYAR